MLFIGVNWPEPTTAAGTRIMQLLQIFLKANFEITFCSTAATSDHSYDLESLTIAVANIELNNSSFDDFISNLQPNIVIFDRFITEEQFGWRVMERAPKALRILDTEDLHSLRTVRGELHKKNIPFTADLWLQNTITKREISSILRCDIALIISSFEMEFLSENIPVLAGLLFYFPFVVRPIDPEVSSVYPNFEKRKDFICIGNGKHAPNVDAFIWLKHDIWPLITKQLPDSNVYIYGSYLPSQIKQMQKPSEGFYVAGFTENLANTFTQARINLAPLRYGAGLKGKLLDAMRYGTPSITTAIGAEGFVNHLPFNGFIANSAEEIAAKAVALYTNEASFQQAQKNGYHLLEQEFNVDHWAVKLLEAIIDLRHNLDKNRLHNFMGSLLQHNSMQSTKYMSKWIEAKNS